MTMNERHFSSESISFCPSSTRRKTFFIRIYLFLSFIHPMKDIFHLNLSLFVLHPSDERHFSSESISF
ncbi:hypothetical protein V7182_04665, partial [Neobacillus drentensis]|uniref:hypothetical protein n=1 Tax=Neobacillus drentensis TaxID=220684 RepID=UPI00300021F1